LRKFTLGNFYAIDESNVVSLSRVICIYFKLFLNSSVIILIIAQVPQMQHLALVSLLASVTVSSSQSLLNLD